MGKNRKNRKNNASASASKTRDDGMTDGVYMNDISEGESLKDDNPMYGSSSDQSLINAILNKAEKEKGGLSEEEIFGKDKDAPDKVCPKCGMELLGNSNYCIGCGMTVKPVKKGDDGKGDSLYDGYFHKGAGYGGGNAYVAREEALKKRRKKKKKNILEEDGLSGFLLRLIGITAGVLIGILVLRWYYAPKAQDITLYRECQVTKLANIKTISAGVPVTGINIVQNDKNDKNGKNGQAGLNGSNQNGSAQTGSSTANSTANSNAESKAKKKNQFFYGTFEVHAMGDRVEWMEETEEWDITGLEPNDVTYVINNLNILYEVYQNYIFMDYELTREETKVVMHFAYHNLNLPDNVKAMAQLGIIDRDAMEGKSGKEYFSYEKTLAELDFQGWNVDLPDGMIQTTPEAEKEQAYDQ